jgi:fatty-acyl-CoA synthase
LYWATACTGVVCHTINIRLFPEQIAYIVEHARDRVVFVDPDLVDVLGAFRDQLAGIERIVVMGGDAGGLDALAYEELIDGVERWGTWPLLDERSPMMYCYTSGTTGNPKGVAYTQRSTYLHTISHLALNPISAGDNVMPVVPMFHAAAWGFPFEATTQGSKITYPGPDLSPRALAGLIEQERVTFTAGVPTVFLGLKHHLEDHPGVDVSSLRQILCGGSAVPRSLIEWFHDERNIDVVQAWGMTETNPVASVAVLNPRQRASGRNEQLDLLETAGVRAPGLEMRIVDDEGLDLPHDGEAAGELLIRGPWIAAEYLRDPRSAETVVDGWLRTGDVCKITPEGFVRIADRAKDVIKSGGEWISSIDVENAIMAHPAIAEATVVGLTHPHWQERPVAFVVLKPGAAVTEDELKRFLEPMMAKWWLPDRMIVIDEIPKTGTGKFAKKVVRAEYSTLLGSNAD